MSFSPTEWIELTIHPKYYKDREAEILNHLLTRFNSIPPEVSFNIYRGINEKKLFHIQFEMLVHENTYFHLRGKLIQLSRKENGFRLTSENSIFKLMISIRRKKFHYAIRDFRNIWDNYVDPLIDEIYLPSLEYQNGIKKNIIVYTNNLQGCD